MVVRKRLDYGSRGHQVPTLPCVPNSARGKRATRRKKNVTCAFDLLVTVAASLLADQDGPAHPNINGAASSYAKNRKSVKEEHFDEILPLKSTVMEKNGGTGCVVGSGGVSAFPRQANICLAENSSTRNETESVLLESLTLKSNMLVRDSLVSCPRSYGICPGLGIIPECRAFGVSRLISAGSAESEQVQQAEPKVVRRQVDEHATALYSLFDSVDLDGRPPALVSSDSSSGVPWCSHDKENKSSSLCQGQVQQAATRDDDENSSGCTHPSTTGNKGYKPHYLGDHRIRKLFASKARKAARSKICGGMSNKGSRLNFRGKKISTTRQKVQRTIFKRTKLVQDQFTTSLAKGMLTEDSGTSFCVEGPKKSFRPEDYHVKIRIKSFKIPELFIEIPENATVGSLKKTVRDVVTSIMEGDLRVGVLLQGKNIQDDNKTLRQAGICHGEELNNLDFALECEAGQNFPSRSIIPEEMDLSSADVVEPLARMKFEEPFPETKFSNDNQQSMQAYPNCSFTGPGCVHCPVDVASQDTSASSQAIVPVAPADLGALAIVPLCKSRRSEIGQRRTRRPFSIAEVEALVEAVEHIGTGRWRDVKMRAFDSVCHRTYVDLKDKWKTLVHTASISPQQRRGQPVPQELLDRVLAAQAYWSQQQARLQDKQAAPIPEICLT